LLQAIAAYRAALLEYTPEKDPLSWAMTQNNLGVTLDKLGERESGPEHLQQAIAAYRAALVERTREKVPLDWAMTQNNLGDVMHTLGQRNHDPGQVCNALHAHLDAWQVVADTSPYYRSMFSENAMQDVVSLRKQFAPSAYYACLTNHDIKVLYQMLWSMFTDLF
jgi:hypothetical protein